MTQVRTNSEPTATHTDTGGLLGGSADEMNMTISVFCPFLFSEPYSFSLCHPEPERGPGLIGGTWRKQLGARTDGPPRHGA